MGFLDLEVTFPALAQLARANRTSLHDLAGESSDHPGYCGLRDCCWMARKGYPQYSHADCHDYLSTINAYLEIPWPVSVPSAEMWRRLSTGNQSMFLDTISELAWALWFHIRGIVFEPEAKFFPDAGRKANADFLIGTRGAGLWLDVNSVELAPLAREAPAIPHASYPSFSKPYLIKKLVGKAINKYSDKFNREVVDGPLKGQPTGLLLGLHKAEKESIPALTLDLADGIREPVPEGLFTDLRPELTMVWVYILTRAVDAPFLLPTLIFRWDRPGIDPSALDWLSPGMLKVSMQPIPYDISGLIEKLWKDDLGRIPLDP